MKNVVVNSSGRALRPDRIFMLEFESSYDGTHASVVRARAVRRSDGRVFELEPAVGMIAERLNNLGAVFVWVWDISFWGGFLFDYALSNGMKSFEEAEKRKRGRGAAEPCYSALCSASHGCLNFRLTLRRTALSHGNRGGRVGGLHTVEYRGVAPFFQYKPFEKIAAACGCDDLLGVYKNFVRSYSELAGEPVETFAYLRKVYTIGGAARRKYLIERYGSSSLLKYHKEHPQDEECDDYFRARKIVLSGMCFFPSRIRGELVKKRLIKYDVNSLYSDIANKAGDLGYPRECTFEEFTHGRNDDKVTYVIVLRGLVAYRKREMPNCFCSPFDNAGGDYINIPQQFAMFRELYFALQKFYTFEEFEVMRVFRVEKFEDPAIQRYNDFFAAKKIECDRLGDGVGRMVAKLFLTNICGKMIQNTRYVPVIPFFDESGKIVIFKHGKVVDNWEKGHFHLLRGAYIYTLARVRVMNDILELLKGCKNPAEHHFYTDTDSIVTDVSMPTSAIDAERVGAYKVECEYDMFGVFAKKVYFGRKTDGTCDLTAAGIRKGTVLEQIAEAYGDLPAEQIFEILKTPAKYETWVQVQVSGGKVWIPKLVRVQDIDVDKIQSEV